MAGFEIQGHRGARGLKPENTLASFESAIDGGATSIETDLHLTVDGVPILVHDSILDRRIYRATSPTAELPEGPCHWSKLTLAQVRALRADGNPNPQLFPDQESSV